MKQHFSNKITAEQRDSLSAIDFCESFEKGLLLKQDRFSEARLLTINHTMFFVKLYRDKGFIGRVKRYAKLSRAWRVFSNTKAVYKNFSYLPKPLAYIEQADGAFYIAEGFSDSVDLRAFEQSGLEIIKKYSLISRVACMLADLHNAGFSHGDMKWGNVLFCQLKNTLYFVDWDGCKKTNKVKFYQRDAARFIVGIRESGLAAELESLFLKQYMAQIHSFSDCDGIDRWVKKFELRHKVK